MDNQKLQQMKEYLKKVFFENPKIKKTVGVILVLVGLIALLTPFTPGSWLIFVGLELLGLRFLLLNRMKQRLRK